MSDPALALQYPDPRQPLHDPRTGQLTRETLVFLLDLARRTGGAEVDLISTIEAEAYEAKALALAAQASAAAALGFTTNPADPLSYTIESASLATVNIAGHTRSTAGAPIVAGSLTGLARGVTHLIHYQDAGNAGGVVTFAATTDPRDMNTAGRRMVGAIFIPNTPPRVSGG